MGDNLLPDDLVEAETFADTEPNTGYALKDQIVSIEMAEQFRKALRRAKTVEKNDDGKDEEDLDEGNDEDDEDYEDDEDDENEER